MPRKRKKISQQKIISKLLGFTTKRKVVYLYACRRNGVKRKGSWLRPKSQSGSPTSGSATKSRLGFSRRHMDSMKRYSRDEARRKAQWVSDCRKLQKRVAKLNRALDHAKMCLEAATSAKNVAAVSFKSRSIFLNADKRVIYTEQMADGEAREWKESLCQQFQLLVQDSNRLVC